MIKRLIKKICSFFKALKQKHIIKKEFEMFEKSFDNLPLGEQFAMKTFNTANLAWNGKPQKFVIGNINAVDLIFCGRFPNIHASLINELLRVKGEFSKETEQEIDIVKLQKEEAEYCEELCKKTLIKPTYNELYNSIVQVKKSLNVDFAPSSVKDVLPSDFLQELQAYHFNRLVDIVKKNLG